MRRHAGTGMPPTARMFEMITGSPAARALHVAARLDVAGQLREGPRTVEEIAAATGAQAHSLRRLLRALASVGVFARGRDGRFRQTPLSDTLRDDAPGSVRRAALITPHAAGTQPWGDLYESVVTGRPAFEGAHDARFFDYLAGRPERAAAFDEGMASASRAQAPAVRDAYDFAPARTVVDVGGGYGDLLAVLLAAHPHLRGVLFDRPEVVEKARAPEEAGVGDRCALVPGDFFQAVPPGGDLYLLKAILHDWDDDAALRILRHVRAALPAAGRVLVIEMVLPRGSWPHPGFFMDLNLMVLTGGKERTRAEFASLFRAAGLRLARVLPTDTPLCLLEAIRSR